MGGHAGAQCVGLLCRVDRGRPGYMVIDADTLPWGKEALLGQMLRRSDVIGQPIATEVFAIIDAVAIEDPRLASFIHDSR